MQHKTEKKVSNKARKLAKELTKLLNQRINGVDDLFYSKDADALAELQDVFKEWEF